MRHTLIYTSIIIFSLCSCIQKDTEKHSADNLYSFNDDMEARWSSPENLNGVRGAGGKENNSAKGHPSDHIKAGEQYVLLDTKGSGIIQRIWITISDRSPEMLRALKLEIFWDGAKEPAVSVPFGDFFGVGLGRTTAFQNALFANAEGRSFNSFIPMPFKEGARVLISNESNKELQMIFFDVDYSVIKNWSDDYLYFHAFWHRDTATKVTSDYEFLHVKGKGRFLGVNIGVNGNPAYKNSWFGEGEVKMYLDGDTDYPTLNGTGTEDYIGTAWGQGKFINNYTGCTIADDSLMQWCFYRFHIPDPIYFKKEINAVIQMIGGAARNDVAAYQKAGASLSPVTISDDSAKLHHLYSKGKVVTIDTTSMPNGWTNFYRSDDVSSTAYFYLDKPVSGLPAIQSSSIRTALLRDK